MPTYEYLCQACGHRFEKWQKMIDEPLTECPECSGHIRRVLFPAGIVFKGNGFYKTDHGNGSLPASSETARSDGAAAKNGSANEGASSSSSGESSTGTKTSESSTSTSSSATSKS